MKLGIVLVEPEYDGNIGFTARCMENFGCKDLWLVKPKANHLSNDAIARAMKGRHILEKAKIVESLEEALENFDVSAATTARKKKGTKLFRELIALDEFAQNYGKFSGKLAVVFGPEKNGLTNEQLKHCDVIITIPAYGKYPTFNLSHAVAIALYEISKRHFSQKIEPANRRLRKEILKQFNELIRVGGKVRNREDTLFAFKGFLARAVLSHKEANAILTVFSSVLKKFGVGKKK